jgi:hypothetical protein
MSDFSVQGGGHPNEGAKLDDLFDRIAAEAGAPTQVRVPVDGISIAFSNTGLRSNGWFILTIEQIVQTLQDLHNDSEDICVITGSPAAYDESIWRSIFETHLTDDVARTMGKVQTLPLFELLSKVVHYSNFTSRRIPKTLALEDRALEIASDAVLAWRTAAEQEGDTKNISLALTGGENVIFYGAPGTGKSNRVNEKIKDAGKQPFRTVFHPDLQNSDFFGCLKPQMNGKDVHYGFSPGPFMSALAEAYKTPDEPVFLVIEELNRAAAAAVFGDLFLLLDREDDGTGEYDVSFPSTESREWFEAETGVADQKLLLPSNLFIYATMNSADQGVYPIDTAFRRRWRQEYLPLDYDKGPEGDVSFVDAAGSHHPLAWRKFVKLLNRHLVSSQTLGIAEDRLLGQWFVKKKELDGDGIPDKVLLYLWDDLLRHEGREHIFDAGTSGKVKTYGDLVIEAAAGRRFLSDSFLGKLNAASDVEPEQEDETGDDAP